MPDALLGSKPAIPAVFLDWAGTVVDHGSVAPVQALENIFNEAGVPVERPLVRRFMGLAKKDHIRKLLEEPEVGKRWLAVYRRLPGEADVDSLYSSFEPQMLEQLAGYGRVIAGAVEIAENLRKRGIKICGTTGYTRPMLERLELIAAEQGYRTDRSLCPEDVGEGRPYPWMCYQLAIDLRIFPLGNCVKIGDTESDIEEGIRAGMWTIGLTRSGNAVGLTEEEWSRQSSKERDRLLSQAEHDLVDAGAHYTAETIAHVLPTLKEIERRIESGKQPPGKSNRSRCSL